ncbi:response regulator [Ramlibacter sp. MAH-25]|uniref:histidine kinase n=2 Tax=Comamonadaceae TaxID=80864 RepID=A0A6N8J2H5_9BURK|nr:response regulator [Ramlibacter sp. CGMCC 1.13660]MVQ32396.1 response regulator [Ramlibacter pinisoli]
MERMAEGADGEAGAGEMTRRSVEMLLRQTRAGAGISVLLGGIFGLILVPAAGWTLFLCWYGPFLVVMLARQPYFDRVVARDGPTEFTLLRVAILAAFSGWLAAVTLPLFSRYLGVAHVGVLTILLVGWVALAVGVLAVQPRVYAVYVTVCMLTIFLGWIGQAEGLEMLTIGVGMVLGGFMLVQLARVIHGQVRDAVVAGEQNARLVGQLRDALARQQEAQRARSRFLGAASHDLRQPVQALLFLSDIFRKSTDSARRDAMAQQIMRTGESIDNMFRHLVDFAQIDAGTMKVALQPVDLNRLVHGAISGFAEKCAAKGLRFRVDPQVGGTVIADPVLLERVLRNFLDNACKYSLHGEIVLRVRQVAGDLEVCVQDEGVGMDEEDLAQVWNAFHRGRSAGLAEAEGIGLGLAICRHMADLMRAGLELTSAPGQGTRAAIRLPVPQGVAAAARVPVPGLALVLAGRLVAVLENDKLARLALESWLQEAGAQVAAGSGLPQLRAALAAAGRAPDFILADYRLNEGDGAEAIRSLRAEHGEIPALIISGEPDLDERSLGVPFLQKPVTPDKLLEQLRRSLPAPDGVRLAD